MRRKKKKMPNNVISFGVGSCSLDYLCKMQMSWYLARLELIIIDDDPRLVGGEFNLTL